MNKRLLCILGGIVLSLATISAALAQNTPTTTTQTTAVQNTDGSWTVIEYPTGKEVIVNLNPVAIQNATGRATIHRMADGTMINLNLTGLPADILARYRERLVKIPMLSPRVRSLNLSTSVALALYELLRQRRTET